MVRQNYLVKNIINNVVVYNSKNDTILQACSNLGIEIPRYCYHNRLSIAGNCRMCLVEIYGVEKPVVACAQKVSNNLHVLTNSEVVRRMREGISKFLLYNHPLDCAICDQGGECDLQDQVMVYGSDKSRFYDYKRTVLDKECGPLIKTVMTRCIHCTRCVRFLQEVAGDSKLGVLGRGQTMEIGNYLDELITSELSGNVIDLCPVGALTSKPSAFMYRSWELRSVESLDLFDNVHSNIRLDINYGDIMRITPIINDIVNEEWIHDKVRFSYDGLIYNRLGNPLKRIGTHLVQVGWKDVINEFKLLFYNNLINLNYFNIITSTGESVESLHLSNVFSKLLYGSSINNEIIDTYYDFDFINNYGLTINLSDLDKYKLYILVGHNFRLESPIINLKIRRSTLLNSSKVFYFGSIYNINYNYCHKGLSNSKFKYWIYSTEFKNLMSSNLGGLLLINNLMTCLDDNDKSYLTKYSNLILNSFNNISNSLNIYNYGSLTSIYFNYNSLYFYKDINYKYFYKLSKSKLLKQNIYYFININDTLNYNLNYNTYYNYIIYQGFCGYDKLINNVDLILPCTNYVESNGTYYNINNLKQFIQVGFTAPKNVRSSIDIFNLYIKLIVNLYSKYNKVLSISNISNKILLDTKLLSNKSRIRSKFFFNGTGNFLRKSPLFISRFDDYYNTNLITLSSRIMSHCSTNLTLYSNYIF